MYIYSSSFCAASTDFPDFLSPIFLSHPSLLAGLLNYIQCPYGAVVDRF